MTSIPRCIVLADPNESRRLAAANVLLQHQFGVLHVATHQQLLDTVRYHRPSAVVVDAQLLGPDYSREQLLAHGLDIEAPITILNAGNANSIPPMSMVWNHPLTEHHAAWLNRHTIPPANRDTVQSEADTSSRTGLLYALPHEYRTPLTDIIGQSAFLHNHVQDVDAETVREMSDAILRAARRLLHTTDNFLLYAQLETLAESPLHIELMRKAVSQDAFGIIADAATDRAVAHVRTSDLEIQLSAEMSDAAINPQYLERITLELVDNAFRFSTAGQKVYIALDVGPTTMRMVITDQGLGMSSEELSQIGPYLQFQRMEREQQGIGLGLVLAKRLVEIHGGLFAIDSAPYSGTRVTVTLVTPAAHTEA